MPAVSSFGRLALPVCVRRSARALIASTFLVSSLSGCGSLYLHSDAAQQATATAKTELDKVSLASVFDNEAAYLDDLQKREYAAVAESLSAQRDDSVLKMLQGTGTGGADGRQFLASRIDGYLQKLAGTSDRGGDTKLWRLIDNTRFAVKDENPLADALAAALKEPRNKLTAPRGEIFELFSPSDTTLAAAIKEAQDAAKDKATKKAAAEEARKTLKADLAKAAAELSAGKASQQTFTDLLTKVNGFLKEAKDKANPYLGEYVSETVQESLDDLIKVTDPKGIETPQTSTARAAIGFVHAAFGVGDAFSNPPRVPHPNALAATKAWLQYEASLAETEFAAAQAEEAFVRTRLEAVVQQVYYLSRAGDELSHVSTQPLTVQEGLAKLIADKDPKKPEQSRAANAALYYYTTAWTKGFIPAQQLNETQPLINRRKKLEQSRKAAEAWLGTLKPAVATLTAYGEGGIDPHIVAELLQALGIGAIAVGVN